jgi:hypothetical protein
MNDPLNRLDHPGIALAGFMLSFQALLELIKIEVLTEQRGIEIIEQSLLNLETHEVVVADSGSRECSRTDCPRGDPPCGPLPCTRRLGAVRRHYLRKDFLLISALPRQLATDHPEGVSVSVWREGQI